MPASELPLWKALYHFEPWGFEADEKLTARICFHSRLATNSLTKGTTLSDFVSPPIESMRDLAPEEEEAQFMRVLGNGNADD